jgi:predicted AAA+ superfamily ATPase
LVKEIATEFGGRSLAWELYPFSFSEYVASKRVVRSIPPLLYMSSDDIQYVRQWFDEYLAIGGIPESLLMSSETTRVKFLQDLAHTVVFRDVIERFNLTNVTELRRLMLMTLNQMGGLTSLNKLKSRMAGEGYRISAAMVRDAIEYFEDAYLIHTIEIFSMNRAVRSTNPKKFYAGDHALAMAVSQKITPNLGNILENIIFLHLRRNYRQIYWARTPSGKEIDFVTIALGTPAHPTETIQLWQICYEMENQGTFERETQALWEGMNVYGVKNGTIITHNTEQQLTKEGMIIDVIPAWKFLLSPLALQ